MTDKEIADSIREAVQEGLAERQREQLAAANFDKEWRELRDGAIRQCFELASQIFSDKLGGGQATYEPYSAVLNARWGRADGAEYSMTIKADREHRLIVCMSSAHGSEPLKFSSRRDRPTESS